MLLYRTISNQMENSFSSILFYSKKLCYKKCMMKFCLCYSQSFLFCFIHFSDLTLKFSTIFIKKNNRFPLNNFVCISSNLLFCFEKKLDVREMQEKYFETKESYKFRKFWIFQRTKIIWSFQLERKHKTTEKKTNSKQ